ncbi:MAG: LysM peptidoglycan-binding domain-containing protein [Proteobacteria bacterium]|nr:LysM peptidoglycan-binding domain-containing protein [Pseudomonadota bacterium]
MILGFQVLDKRISPIISQCAIILLKYFCPLPISQRVKPMKRSNDLKIWFQCSLILGVILMSACSSSKHAKEGEPASEQAQADTGKAPTDAVPGVGASGEVEDNVELVLAREAQSEQGATASAGDSSGSLPPSPGAADSGASSNTAVTTGPAPASVASTDAPAAESASASAAAGNGDSATTSEPTASASNSDSGSAGGEKYKVKAGDTLMKISWEQYGTLFRWREIYNANKGVVQDPNHVPPGTVLTLSTSGRSPASAMEHTGDQYLIQSGDTLGTISGKVYGSTEKWKKIWENNKQLIRDPNKIYAGFYLYYVPENKKMTSVDEKDGGAEGAADSGTG